MNIVLAHVLLKNKNIRVECSFKLYKIEMLIIHGWIMKLQKI